uniref:Uncharacterized protein n=1 Tax=Anguilla anguilla TaxID=7936 RepID=A0A0E9UHY7_ANGAN
MHSIFQIDIAQHSTKKFSEKLLQRAFTRELDSILWRWEFIIEQSILYTHTYFSLM